MPTTLQPVPLAQARTDSFARQKFLGLEWLRFLLAVYLVLYHTLRNYPEVEARVWLDQLIQTGHFATSSFFVLSGFLLTHAYADSEGQLRLSRGEFLIRRFSNLYPIHLLTLLLAFLVTLDFGAPLAFSVETMSVEEAARAGVAVPTRELGAREFGLNVLLQLTLTHAWNPLYVLLNRPSWSISALLFFYLTFPFFAPRFQRARHPGRLMGLLIAVYLLPPLLLAAFDHAGLAAEGLLHRNPLVRLPEFLAGVLLYAIYRRQPLLVQQRAPAAAAWAVVGVVFATLAGASWLRIAGGFYWQHLLHNGLLLPTQLALILAATQLARRQRADTGRLAMRLGKASLSIFALHVPLFYLFLKGEKAIAAALALATGDAGSVGEALRSAMSYDKALPWYPIYLAAIVVASVQFQERLVDPLRGEIQGRLLRVLQRRHTSLAAPPTQA